MRRRNDLALLGIGFIVFAGAFIGVSAVAAPLVIPLVAPEGVVPGREVDYVEAPKPVYPVNEHGLTYGSAADAVSPDTEPDLILVVTTTGEEGYAKKTDLDEANGTAAIKEFRSTAEALAWQEERAKRGTMRIPVYERDGTTQIGVFLSVPGGPPDSVVDKPTP